jgi:hypothetical protein
MDERDEKLIAALQEIATEIRALRFTMVSIITPAARTADGLKISEGVLRTEETPQDRKSP